MESKIILVPDGWEQINISLFQEIVSLDKENKDYFIELVSVLSGEDPEDIRKLDIQTINKIIEAIKWINTMPDDANYKPIIKIGEEEFGFITRLNTLSLGEWMDLEHYLSDTFNNLHNVMAILYRPLVTAFNDRDRIIDDYDAGNVNERANLFKEHLMIGDVYGALVFFYLIVQECIKIIPEYFNQN